MFTILLLSLAGCAPDVPTVSLAWHVETLPCEYDDPTGNDVAYWSVPDGMVSVYAVIDGRSVGYYVPSSIGVVGYEVGSSAIFSCNFTTTEGRQTGDAVIVTWASE